ncbi:peptide N-acetyl-beta-D-glucosaminyl asparaginase amidase A [Stackebrandtia albiflava]|uniref:Peptide N-acetyl-beta-D-glucosaminyl asparaginase amidase A n=1 Tax=Stackebrandtia albiflava TaxID=406432 RepID=A0A562V2X7_9ACTN|nr:peptide-N4-asparagine amidase [Stackebrandtia albiflava]TWJ12250.1 peptide N-acetyl-beta-D-glucosaminyl asparaginase amidase A [Stackebrandtia albiflava]
MRRALSAAAVIALMSAVFSIPSAAQAHHDVPEEFGSDWDDPRTAVAPVETPDTESCEVGIVSHAFDDFTPYESTYTPPTECGDDWSKIVLRLDGAVEGRQYDRLGSLSIGGVPVFKTSTPQPSPEGIEWSVEADLTRYAGLLDSPQPVRMELGNVVDDVHTGVLDVDVTLVFYASDEDNPAAEVADLVLPLAEQDESGTGLTGELEVPRNSERLLADVYATGSGGGCEEFWYLTAPADAGYSCTSADGPYREVQVLIDGEVAGIAAPYPHVYTGGWSNPFLWYTLPAPRAFHIQPITYDLTPYLGRLNDGEAHEVSVRVLGLDEGITGWSTPVGFRVWQDAASEVVEGGVLSTQTTALSNDSRVEVTDGETEVVTDAGHRHTVTGWLNTSRGRVMTTVDRVVGHHSRHVFGPEENPDALAGEWFDVETRTVLNGRSGAEVRKVERTYGIDGRISVDADGRLTTEIELTDELSTLVSSAHRTVSGGSVRDHYTGEASWDLYAPRPDRHAVGVSTHRYTVLSGTGMGNEECYDRQLRTRNGFVVSDRRRC